MLLNISNANRSPDMTNSDRHMECTSDNKTCSGNMLLERKGAWASCCRGSANPSI